MKQIQLDNQTRPAKVRVRIIKAPLVDTVELKQIILARARALVL